ncbi:MAG: ATP-binding protein [Spirosomataceae bacterium]
MKIGTKIALQFTFTVATILTVFCLVIYYLSENYRQQEFFNSLKDRAATTARLLIKEKEIDKKLLKIIDRNTLDTLYGVQVLVFNDENLVAYSNYEADTFYYNPELINRIRTEKYLETSYKDKQVVGSIYTDDENRSFVILAQATDKYGKDKLNNIKETLIIGLFSTIIITVLFGFIFASHSLKPIAAMNNEISKITAYNLKTKLNTGNQKDELARLAINFNQMLARLENSFELQKSFVSNASHELRTPLAAIKSEIQIALEKDRSTEEYKHILKSLLIDNQQIIKLINGLLQLAKSEKSDSEVLMNPVRIDAILFETQEEINYSYPEYSVQIDFDAIPEDDNQVTVHGNAALLKTVFVNLIENACKYSDSKSADIRIIFNAKNCIISIKDEGIGIPKAELSKIFEPFYRSQNASVFKGHGIGLSICKRIIQIHGGRLTVKSELGQGSTFRVILPHI